MNVLIACEESATVRDAFLRRGHNAWSCDLLPSRGDNNFHYRCDVFALFKQTNQAWDLIIAHPPCTHLSVSGARWCVDHWVKLKNKPARWHDGYEKRVQRTLASTFFMRLINESPAKRIAVEQPVSVMSTLYRKPDQIIQPWMFGHGETKATCLWLTNLPKLIPTNIVEGREARIHKMPPSKDRAMLRSQTYQGIADAMAEQWGCL